MLRFPKNKVWIDYDKEADVLYLSFDRPQKATDSEMLDNGVLLRYKSDKLVGMTIPAPSQASGYNSNNRVYFLDRINPSTIFRTTGQAGF